MKDQATMMINTDSSPLQASATSLMRKIPRFGKTSDFARIALGYDAAEDYIIGLLFAAIFVLSTFAAWTIVLLIFKCIGPKRMGYLAGSPFVKGTRRPSIRRIVYLVCAVFFVSFSATFVAKGLSNLKESFTTIVEASRVSTHIMYLSGGTLSTRRRMLRWKNIHN
jgi:hypothetical protein